MNISLKWLKQYLDFDLTAQEVGDALTSLGLEVGASLIPIVTTCTSPQWT